MAKATVGSLADKLWTLREQIRALEKQKTELERDKERLEYDLMGLMEEQGLDKASGKLATISVSETIVPQVTDWDDFWTFVRKRNLPELIQRRVSATAYREVLDERGSKGVPGTTPYSKRRLNVTTLKGAK
jgi:hypothetical protein